MTAHFILLASLLLGQVHSASPSIGYVIEKSGSWFDEKDVQITALYVVRTDSRIARRLSLSTTDYIRIRSFETGREESFHCREPLTCSAPLDFAGRFQGSEQRPGEIQVFLRAIAQLLSTHPDVTRNFARLTSRGGVRLIDGVALLRPEGLDIWGTFERTQPGDFLVKVCPIGKDGDVKCPQTPELLPVAWKPNQSLLLKRPGTVPGLYKLDPYKKVAGTNIPDGDGAFILAATPGNFDRLRMEFDKAFLQAAGWSATDPEAITLLRVYLHYLASNQ